jgi:hypothetical protein
MLLIAFDEFHLHHQLSLFPVLHPLFTPKYYLLLTYFCEYIQNLAEIPILRSTFLSKNSFPATHPLHIFDTADQKGVNQVSILMFYHHQKLNMSEKI